MAHLGNILQVSTQICVWKSNLGSPTNLIWGIAGQRKTHRISNCQVAKCRTPQVTRRPDSVNLESFLIEIIPSQSKPWSREERFFSSQLYLQNMCTSCREEFLLARKNHQRCRQEQLRMCPATSILQTYTFSPHDNWTLLLNRELKAEKLIRKSRNLQKLFPLKKWLQMPQLPSCYS